MANKLYLLLEMPERFHGDNCDRCPTTWRCHEIHGGPGVCPLGASREAMVWDTSKLVMTSKGGDIATMSNPKMNGKPVTLYAVEVEK